MAFHNDRLFQCLYHFIVKKGFYHEKSSVFGTSFWAFPKCIAFMRINMYVEQYEQDRKCCQMVKRTLRCGTREWLQ